ncbi:MAG: FCD domain-containing protein [Armatimonadota bacterium]|nr:FCD domain-containing protein [Armatimonadota bacterium]
MRTRAAPRDVLLKSRALRPVRKSPLYEEILPRLEVLVRERGTVEGARLPPERDLARALGVSRASLREAIRILTIKGVLEPRPGRGTVIRESSTEKLAGALVAVLSAGGQSVLDIMEFRKALEPSIAATAARRATSAEIRDMEAILARAARKVQRGEPAADEDTQFHHALAAATKNPVFVRVTARCMDLIQSTRGRLLQSRARNQASLEAHRRILAAVRDGDAAAAEAAMAAHLDEVTRFILSSEARRAHGSH